MHVARKCLPLFWISIAKSVKNSVWNAFPTWLEVELLFLQDLEMTTDVPRSDSNKTKWRSSSKRSLCIYMNMKNIFIATTQNQNVNGRQTWMEGICQDTTPILGSSSGYREKRSHNRMIDSSPWTSNAYCPKIHLTPLVNVDVQSSVNTVSHFPTFYCWCEEKNMYPNSH